MAKKAKASEVVSEPPMLASLQGARARFGNFLQELSLRFVEREDAIEQVALALFAREHVLFTGPPGTAKSALATAVLQNIVDRSTRKPSVFARQFTENTVQTDLIGPLDFKTLMESGRSEHFTDEGMLGAVHAFLDEVLDGRDMLLRATLNVLQERELKQGSKTTRGAIECALMTTNRYLSEVMEQSRETLLAFVDRIAFVTFIPKSFGKPDNMALILKRQMTGRGNAPMPQITLQDVDELQELVSYVRFPDAISELLVTFLARLEAELSAATRADPKFVPTRYLSVRTVVRTARILRAIVVYDWVVRDRARPLCVLPSDFGHLRLTLLLGGPTLDSLPSLLQRETDSRERRQLSIYQTERQVFDRVLATLPKEATIAKGAIAKLPTLAQIRSLELEEQLAACESLLGTSEQGDLIALEARQLLSEATDVLAHRVLTRTLQAGIGEQEREFAVGNLDRIAELLTRAHPQARDLVPVVRSRALEVLDAQVHVSLTTSSAAIRDVTSGKWNMEHSLKHAQESLQQLENQSRLRSSLLAGGAVPGEHSEERWRAAVERLLTELVQVWELGFDSHLSKALQASKSKSEPLKTLLAALGEPLAEMNACGSWFVPFGKEPTCIAARVVDKKLMPFIERAFSEGSYGTRKAVADAVEQLLRHLDDAKIHWAVSSSALIHWASKALLEAEPPRKRTKKRTLTYDGYREFRKAQPASSLCFVLVEVCTHIALAAPELRSTRSPSVDLVREQLATLPPQLAALIVQEDEARLEEAFQFLEAWWKKLVAREREAQEQLNDITGTRFFELLSQESVLLRFTLEAELLGELFPLAREASEAWCVRLSNFNQAVQDHVHGLMQAQSRGHASPIIAVGDGKGR